MKPKELKTSGDNHISPRERIKSEVIDTPSIDESEVITRPTSAKNRENTDNTLSTENLKISRERVKSMVPSNNPKIVPPPTLPPRERLYSIPPPLRVEEEPNTIPQFQFNITETEEDNLLKQGRPLPPPRKKLPKQPPPLPPKRST